MKRKYITLFVTIFCIGMLIAGSTYAYWTWTSNTNKNIVFSTASGLEDYVIYDEGNSHFVGDFQPSDEYCGGISSTIAFSKTSEASNTSLVATINMDINKIEHNISSSDYVKWAVTYGDNNIDCSNNGDVPTVLQSGSFKGLTSGQTITLMSDIELKNYLKDDNGVSKEMADSLLDKSNTNYNDNLSNFRQNANSNYNMFTVWIWIDSSGSGLSNLSGETLDTNIWTQIDMAESNLLRPGESGTVNYDANCGSDSCEGVPSSQIKVYGEDLTLSSSIPTRVGYTFAGWSTDKDDFSVEYEYKPGVVNIYKLNFRSITLYAVWTPLTYTVTLNGNGATNSDYTRNLTVTYRSSSLIPQSLTLPKREYTVSYVNSTGATIKDLNGQVINVSEYTDIYKMKFDGWTESNGKIVVNNQEFQSLLSNVSGYTDQNSHWIKNSGDTLYAQWSAGDGILLPTIEKDGYICGWNASSSATTIAYYSGKSYKPTANRTLYGVCMQKEEDKVTIDAKVGNCLSISDTSGWVVDVDRISASKTVTINNQINTLPTVVSPTGYKFKKWVLDNGSTVTSSTVLSEDLVGEKGRLEITAYCEPNKVTVKFNTNGGTIASTTTYNGTTYNWSVTSNDTIKRNGDYQFFTINYGESRDLPNADGTYMKVSKTGNGLKSGAEWKCKSGDCTSGVTYSDTGTINASDFCDLTNDDCEVTLGVNWEPYKLLVKFDTNGGTITPQTIYNDTTYNWTTTDDGIIKRNGVYDFFTIGYGETRDLPNADGTYMNVTRKGYSLKPGAEWKCLRGVCSEGTTYSDDELLGANLCDLTKESCEMILGVNWDANSYSINYDLGTGGKLGEKAPTSVKYGRVVEIDEPTREGYIFSGWTSTTTDDSTAKVGSTDSSLNSWNGETLTKGTYFSNLTTVADGTVTLIANWISCEVTILFNVNDGNIAATTSGYSYNWTTTDAGTIKRDGNYQFFKVTNDNPKDLPNYDGSYMSITKTGNHAIDGEEWRCTSGNCVKNLYNDTDSYSASDFCSEFDANGKCTVKLEVNWELNYVTVKFNVNGGNIVETTTYNDKNYTWSVTENDTIKRDGDYQFFKINYGESRDLPNYDGNYMTIYRENYDVKDNEEWICLRDDCTVGNVYSDTGNVVANDLCNLSNGNCEVTLGINWIPILDVTFDLNGGEESLYASAGSYNFSPINGTYKLEAWGAQGGSAGTISGGYGGYSTGNVTITDDSGLDSFYIEVGGSGGNGTTSSNYNAIGGENGGGDGYVGTGAYPVSGGGGASHIAISKYGYLKNYSSHLDDVLLVAGGGGGVGYNTSYTDAKTTVIGHGGGYVGVTSKGVTKDGENMIASGGKQTEIGVYGSGGSFGQGADAALSGYPGGGGGLYGGNNNSYSAGGGSGYIGSTILTDKVMYYYCNGDDCNTSSNSNTLTNSTTNVDDDPISNYAKIGSGAVKITTLSVDKVKATSSKTYNQLPYPSRNGYRFIGWNTKADGSGTTVSNGDTVTLTSNHTLYAQWEIDTNYRYCVTFYYKEYYNYYNCTGNSSVNGSLSGNVGSPCKFETKEKLVTYTRSCASNGEEIRMPNFSKGGYKLAGWSASSGSVIQYAPGDTMIFNRDMNLYAVLTPYEATVRLNVNADNVNIMTPTVYNGMTYNWTITDAGTLKRNGTTDFLKIAYDEYANLPNISGGINLDNIYMKITRNGYVPTAGAEWKCIGGDCDVIGETFDDSEDIVSYHICNTFAGDCTVELGINWSTDTKYLYNAGDEYKSFTGGWEIDPAAKDVGDYYGNENTLDFYENYMYFRTAIGSGSIDLLGSSNILTVKKIDLSEYNTIGFSGTVSSNYDECHFGIYSSKAGYLNDTAVKRINICATNERTIDVSNYEGSYYVGFDIRRSNYSDYQKIKVSKVYLKK